MTGPEHYAAAEALAAEAKTVADAGGKTEPADWAQGRAQVLAALAGAHAGLAQVAATADLFALAGSGARTATDAAATAWERVIWPPEDPLTWWRLAARQAVASGHLDLPGRAGDTIRMVIEQLLTGRGEP